MCSVKRRYELHGLKRLYSKERESILQFCSDFGLWYIIFREYIFESKIVNDRNSSHFKKRSSFLGTLVPFEKVSQFKRAWERAINKVGKKRQGLAKVPRFKHSIPLPPSLNFICIRAISLVRVQFRRTPKCNASQQKKASRECHTKPAWCFCVPGQYIPVFFNFLGKEKRVTSKTSRLFWHGLIKVRLYMRHRTVRLRQRRLTSGRPRPSQQECVFCVRSSLDRSSISVWLVVGYMTYCRSVWIPTAFIILWKELVGWWWSVKYGWMKKWTREQRKKER